MNLQLKADAALMLITVFWGASCLLTKIGLAGLDAFNLMALRFVIAFAVSAVVFRKRILAADARTFRCAAILAAILFAVFAFMTFGVKYTTASNAGFLTCLASIFIPFLALVFLRQRPEAKVLAGVVLAVAGVALLSQGSQVQFNLGDVLCILCSLTFAVHILVMGAFTKAVDSIALGVLQLGFAGVYSLAASLIFEHPGLPASGRSWAVVLLLSLFCTAAAFIVQSVAQKYTTPSHTGLIFTFEPAFAAFFAFAFLGEVLSLPGYLGGFLMVLSILIVELQLPIKGKGKSPTRAA